MRKCRGSGPTAGKKSSLITFATTLNFPPHDMQHAGIIFERNVRYKELKNKFAKFAYPEIFRESIMLPINYLCVSNSIYTYCYQYNYKIQFPAKTLRINFSLLTRLISHRFGKPKTSWRNGLEGLKILFNEANGPLLEHGLSLLLK